MLGLAVGRDEPNADHVVAGQSGLADQPADPTAQGQPGDSGLADETSRDCQAVLLGRGVKFAPRSAAATRRAFGAGVDRDGLHRSQVDHHTAVGERRSGVVVAAAADRNLQSTPRAKASEADTSLSAAHRTTSAGRLVIAPFQIATASS